MPHAPEIVPRKGHVPAIAAALAERHAAVQIGRAVKLAGMCPLRRFASLSKADRSGTGWDVLMLAVAVSSQKGLRVCRSCARRACPLGAVAGLASSGHSGRHAKRVLRDSLGYLRAFVLPSLLPFLHVRHPRANELKPVQVVANGDERVGALDAHHHARGERVHLICCTSGKIDMVDRVAGKVSLHVAVGPRASNPQPVGRGAQRLTLEQPRAHLFEHMPL
eukprot:2063394-Prymnesium_polylepis.2